MPRRKGSRIYARKQGGAVRYYADFRDLGGRREALIAEGETLATTDRVIAEALVAKRLGELQEEKRDLHLLGVRRRVGFAEYAAEHLMKKAKSGTVEKATLAADETQLRVAAEFFGPNRDIATIGVEHVEQFRFMLSEMPRRRTDAEAEGGFPKRGGGTLSPATQRHYLNSLSNMFRRAISEGIIRGVNPVLAMMNKPSGRALEARWLEVWEAALLLEAARTFPYDRPDDADAHGRLRIAITEVLGPGEVAQAEFVRRMRERGKLVTMEKLRSYLVGKSEPTKGFMLAAAEVLHLPSDRLYRARHEAPALRPAGHAYALIATYLLTGARETEVYGLEMRDIDLDRGFISIRQNSRRRIKTKTSNRVIPVWPQLREIIEPHLELRRAQGAGPRDLVFPSVITGGIITDIRRTLDTIAERAGWGKGEIRTKMFRHTYCAARLQTLDNGAPVATYTVSRELGHGGEALVKRVYGHLGQVRHRSPYVEYRVDQQRDVIPQERLRLLLQVV